MFRFLMFFAVAFVPVAVVAAAGPQLVPIEIGGTFAAENLAAASTGAVAFGRGEYGSNHTIKKLNDGVYGNTNSWIGIRDGSFAGVRLSQRFEIAAIAFGRDNTGRYADRCIGTYHIQFTQVERPDRNTPNEEWTTLAIVDYGASPPPKPPKRHLFRFPTVAATGVRIVTDRNERKETHLLAIDELELYGPDAALPSVAVAGWQPTLLDPASIPPLWKSPIKKKGYLGSPLVEVTPVSLKGQLYLLECWRNHWDWPGRPGGATRGDEMWMARLPEGPKHYERRKYLGRVMPNRTLGTAIVWDDRVYVFATGEDKNRREIYMSWSDDMRQWSPSVKVFDSPKGSIFNVAVTRDEQGMVFLWETNGYGRPFTMCYGRVDKPTDPWNPGIIENARYGMDKYTGGPALYYEGGCYYTLYLQSLGGGYYETRITRSKDLKDWQDAPKGRPFITFDPERTGAPLHPKQVKECNASDVELCYHKGKTILFFTGADQHNAGDLQWATYDGTPRKLLEHFFDEEPAREK